MNYSLDFLMLGLEGANIQEPLYFVREDFSAIRRMTMRSCWYTCRTTLKGFRLLDFPFSIRSSKKIRKLAI